MAVMVEHNIELLKITRGNFLKLMENLTDVQLNKIPEGYNNNLIWNYGHTVISQQLLCYKLAGATTRVSESLIELYRIRTAPDGNASVDDIQRLKSLAIQTCDWTLEDYNSGKLTENPFTEYTTSYNTTLKTVEDAIAFNNIHEGLHLGYAMAMKKLVI